MSIIMHNMTASFTSKQLNITTGQKAKAAEKLGSGYRINRSADDAAGLQISEKMRAQIRGLNQASENAEAGVSLIQTAEGAMNEVHDILQRMSELAVQAANDTNTDIDRDAIQQEMNQLKSEINRISKATLFNDREVLRVPQLVEITGDEYTQASMDTKLGIELLMASNVSPLPTTTAYGVGIDFKNVNAGNMEELIGKSFQATCSANCSQTFTFEFIDGTTSNGIPTTGNTGANSGNGTGSGWEIINTNSLVVKIDVKDVNMQNGQDVVDEIIKQVRSAQAELATASGSTSGFGTDHLHIGHANGLSANGTNLILYSVGGQPPYNPGMGLVKAGDMFKEEETIYFQIGATEGQSMEYTIRTMNSDTLKLQDIRVSSHLVASCTMARIQDAINIASKYRSYLGAVQNRLEHTIANLDNTSENTQAAESNIRDTDMAAEMVNLSKNNILEQVGQSILAQANKATQGVLTLLQ